MEELTSALCDNYRRAILADEPERVGVGKLHGPNLYDLQAKKGFYIFKGYKINKEASVTENVCGLQSLNCSHMLLYGKSLQIFDLE